MTPGAFIVSTLSTLWFGSGLFAWAWLNAIIFSFFGEGQFSEKWLFLPLCILGGPIVAGFIMWKLHYNRVTVPFAPRFK